MFFLAEYIYIPKNWSPIPYTSLYNISADPGLRQGRGGAWDHRRCGTFPRGLLNVRGSFHQAWPSAFAAPGLQPALCLHIPRGSFHQAPGRQRSSIAACPLPAHSRLLLGPSSLPFARLQTPKTPKTPKTLPCLHTAGVELFPRGL